MGADAAVRVLCERLCGLDRKAVQVVRLGVLARALERVDALGDAAADGHDLQRDHRRSSAPAFGRPQVIGEAEVTIADLAWKGESAQFAYAGSAGS